MKFLRKKNFEKQVDKCCTELTGGEYFNFLPTGLLDLLDRLGLGGEGADNTVLR